MSEFVFRLPDLGEGTVEAEIVEWHVAVGDVVEEEQHIVDVTTDKATVELPAPVAGRVLRISGAPGESIAVGSELIAIEVASAKSAKAKRVAPATAPEPPRQASPGDDPPPPEERAARPAPPAPEPEPETEVADASTPPREPSDTGREDRPTAPTSPAIRRRARDAGIDLADVAGTGPRGRILQQDLDAYLERAPTASAPATPASAGVPVAAASTDEEHEEIPIIGVRRVIAERMSASKREIPHFAYVEEIDVTEVERLRRHLGATRGDAKRAPGMLPFVALALIRALPDFPMCNAHHDATAKVVRRFRHVHLGIAVQTPDGLKVPVVRHGERLDLDGLASAIAGVAAAARDGTASREQLGGSTITLTSLGKLGGIASTPIINLPEVAIIGVNRAVERPVVLDGQIVIRTMMNLSSAFDHRFVDGHDAASLVKRIKDYLEHPATLFMAQ